MGILRTALVFTWAGCIGLSPALAQPYDTSIGWPQGVAKDGSGNVYFSSLHSVFKLDQNGVVTRIAGNLQAGYSGDGGPATDAQLFLPDEDEFLFPIGLVVDSAGNLYVADSGNIRVRKVSPDGIITTVAGNGTWEYLGGYSGDGGSATSTPLMAPQGLAVDSAGNLYIADYTSIRKVSPDGIITTMAGNGGWGCTGTNPFFICESGDGGPATSATLVGPTGVTVDGAGNLYVADSYNGRVRKVSPDGIITTVAGDGIRGSQGYSGDGLLGTSAQMGFPTGLAIDSVGNLYIADSYYANIRKLSADGIITTVAAQLNFPLGLAVDCGGNLLFVDGGKINRLSPSGAITILAGPGADLPQAASSIRCVANGAFGAERTIP